MTAQQKLPRVFAITEEEIGAILNVLGEVQAKLATPAINTLVSIGSDSRLLPEDLVRQMTTPPQESEEGDEGSE